MRVLELVLMRERVGERVVTGERTLLALGLWGRRVREGEGLQRLERVLGDSSRPARSGGYLRHSERAASRGSVYACSAAAARCCTVLARVRLGEGKGWVLGARAGGNLHRWLVSGERAFGVATHGGGSSIRGRVPCGSSLVLRGKVQSSEKPTAYGTLMRGAVRSAWISTLRTE